MENEPKKNRRTTSFEPTKDVADMLAAVESAGMVKGQLINEAIQRHLPDIIRKREAALAKAAARVIEISARTPTGAAKVSDAVTEMAKDVLRAPGEKRSRE